MNELIAWDLADCDVYVWLGKWHKTNNVVEILYNSHLVPIIVRTYLVPCCFGSYLLLLAALFSIVLFAPSVHQHAPCILARQKLFLYCVHLQLALVIASYMLLFWDLVHDTT